jgi:flagellin-like hook-associated protein FlgL
MTGSIGQTNALTAYLALEKNRDRYLTRFKNSDQIKKDIAYFEKKAASIKTVDEFVNDPKLLAFAATAFGLDADLKYPARLKKVLKESLSDDNALANKLIDPRYKEMAKFFSFGELQLTKIQVSVTRDELIEKYTTAAFEKAQGQTNPALRDALYFERKASSITTGYDILGDNVLRAVVTYTLDLPPQIAVQSVEKQRQLIEQKLDIKKFQSTAAVTTSQKITDAVADLGKLDPLTEALAAAQAQVTAAVDRLQALRDSYDRLANEVNPAGPYAAEIPTQNAAVPGLGRQQGLLASAGQATTALGTIQSSLNAYITEALDPGTTPARITELKTLFQDAVNQASQLVADADYGTESLLDGSVAGPIDVVIKSGGQSITVRSHNVNNGVLDNLAAANAAFQADNFSGALTSQQASSTALADVQLQISQDTQIFSTGIASVARWVPSLDTANIYTAQQTVVSAQNATGTAQGIINQIRSLAETATDTGLSAAERTALNDEYILLRDQLRDAIAAGTYSGNSLLDGSSVSIGAGAGANEVVIDASSNTLAIGGNNIQRFADDTAPPAESLYNLDLTSAASAQSVVDSIDTDINPELQRTFRTLGTYSGVYGLLAETLDPRGALDAEYRRIVEDLDGFVKAAESKGVNLLESFATDLTVRSSVTGAAVTAHAQNTFRSFVEDTLSAGAGVLLTDFTAARRALDDAAFFARRFQTNIKTDTTIINAQKTQINQAKSDAEAAQGSTQGLENAFLEKFIQRYLLKKDAEAAKALTGASTGNSYLLSLLT